MSIPIGDVPLTDPFLGPILATNTIKLGYSTRAAVQDPTPATLIPIALDVAQLSMIAGHWALVKKDHELILEGDKASTYEKQGVGMAGVLFIYIPVFTRMCINGFLWNMDRTASKGLTFANDVATLALLAARHGTSNSEAIHEKYSSS